MSGNVWNLSASELAKRVASGETSALEIIENHLDRIKAVNSKVNGIVNVLEDSALEAAKEVDRRRAAGKVLGDLAGVPFTIKENIDVGGLSDDSRCGSVARCNCEQRRTNRPAFAGCRCDSACPHQPSGSVTSV